MENQVLDAEFVKKRAVAESNKTILRNEVMSP